MGSLEPTEQTTAAATATEEAAEAGDNKETAAPEEAAERTDFTVEVHTDVPVIVQPETPAPIPGRGDGPNNIPQVGNRITIHITQPDIKSLVCNMQSGYMGYTERLEIEA